MLKSDKKIKRKVGVLAILGVLLLVSFIPISLAAPSWDDGAWGNKSYFIDIDTNNDDTDQAFAVSHHGDQAYGTELFRVQEDGKVGIANSMPTAGLDSMVSVTASTGAAWGANFESTLTAAANNDELIGVRISPQYVDGGYTGVAHYGLIVEDGDVGIGTETPSAKLHSLTTSEQLRLGYDASNYVSFTVASDGDLSVKPTGNGQIKIQPTTDSTDFLQILDATGTTILNVDATNERMGIGTSSPDYKLQVDGVIAPETSDQDLGTSSLRWDLYANAINADGLGTGTDDTILILDSSNQVTTDEIDSRVWGSTLTDGSGTAGHVTYWSDTDTITYDNGKFYWDASNDRLGLGTANPDQLLHLGDDTNNINGVIRFEDIYGDEIDLGITSNADFYITGGDVGIGDSSPDALLDIHRPDLAFQNELHDLKVTGFTQTISGTRSNARFNWFGQSTITAVSSQTVTRAATVYIAGAPIASGSVSITKPYAVWVDDGDTRLDGAVGIGTGESTLSHKAEIYDTSTTDDRSALYIRQTGGPSSGETVYGLYVTKTGTGSGTNIAGYFSATQADTNYALQVQGTMLLDQKIQAQDGGGLEFATDEGTTRIVMDDSGRMGIGDTSPEATFELVESGSTPFMISDGSAGDGNHMIVTSTGLVGIGDINPSEELTVVGTIRATYAATESNYIEMSNSGTDGIINTAVSGSQNLYFQHDGTTYMTLDNDGDLAVNSNTATASLDVNGDIIRIRSTFTPTGSSTGSPGMIAWDTGFLYVCTATNTWERVALDTF